MRVELLDGNYYYYVSVAGMWQSEFIAFSIERDWFRNEMTEIHADNYVRSDELIKMALQLHGVQL